MYEHLRFNQIPRGRDYEPAIKIQDLPSNGQSARIPGIKTNRQHDLLSINEQNYFYIAEFNDNVVDIREQFPMNIDITLLIAQQLGLEHPVNLKEREPNFMSSDFCITVTSGGETKDFIRTVKPAQDLTKRTIGKFEIERVYWEQEGIDWGIVTDQEIDKTMAKNIGTFRVAYDISNVLGLQELGEATLIIYKRELAIRIINENDTTRNIIHSFAREFHIPVGACITLFRHLLATKVLRCNLHKVLNLNLNNEFSLGHQEMDELLCAE